MQLCASGKLLNCWRYDYWTWVLASLQVSKWPAPLPAQVYTTARI